MPQSLSVCGVWIFAIKNLEINVLRSWIYQARKSHLASAQSLSWTEIFDGSIECGKSVSVCFSARWIDYRIQDSSAIVLTDPISWIGVDSLKLNKVSCIQNIGWVWKSVSHIIIVNLWDVLASICAWVRLLNSNALLANLAQRLQI